VEPFNDIAIDAVWPVDRTRRNVKPLPMRMQIPRSK
jgi:hypothetical protein